MGIVVRIFKKSDEKKIVDFLGLIFKKWPKFDVVGTPLDHWLWKYHIPDNVVVAEDQGNIVGSFHSIPLKIKVGNDIIDSCQGVDVAVHPDYRGEGVYGKLREKSYETRIKNGIKMHYGISGHPKLIAKRKHDEKENKEMFPIFPHKLLEYVKIKDIDEHLKYTKSDNVILKKIGFKLLNQINKLSEIQNTNSRYNIKIKKVDKFDHRINNFWSKIQDKYKFSIVKDQNYLNWRYCDLRGGYFQIIEAVDDNNIIWGFIVIKINRANVEYPLGYIADLIFLPEKEEVGKILLMEALKYLEKEKINTIYSIGFENSQYEKLYKKFGFIKNIKEPYMTITVFMNISSSISELDKSRIEEVIFSYGDLDWI